MPASALGQKIRRLRMQLGLSQQQLAGSDMTRAFVSMVEQGKAKPSLETLRIIAGRLNQPMSIFLETQEEQGDQALLEVLFRNANLLTQAEQFTGALDTLEQAYRLCKVSANLPGQLTSLEQMGLTLQKLGKYEEALDQFEQYVEIARAAQQLERIAQGYNYMGNTLYMIQQFMTAKRYYNRAIQVTENRKSLMEVRQKVLVNKGNCLVRLGGFEEAAIAYEEVLELYDYLGDKRLLAYGCLGLGCAYRRLNKLKKAIEVTKRSLDLFEELQDQSRLLALHNLATQECDIGEWDRAFPKLETCRDLYHALCWITKEAAVYGDLGRYWFANGENAKAIDHCQEALRLLAKQDDPLTRGEVYGQLGNYYLALGQLDRAVEHLEMSACVLRYVGDQLALQQTIATLEHARGQSGSS